MKRPKRFGLKISVLMLLIFIASGLVLKSLWEAGEFDTIWDHPLPDCHLLSLTGAEDMTLVDKDTRVLISVTVRQGLQSNQQSGVYLYDGNAAPKLVYPTNGIAMGISAIDTD